MSGIQKELRLKGKIILGDKMVLYGGEWMLLKPGDRYLAEIEGEEIEILTCRRVEVQKRRTGKTEGKVFPKERKKKLYNLHEVIKIVIVDNPEPKKAKHVPNPGPRQDDRRREESNSGESRPTPAPRPNRPMPRDPRGAGRTDYTANSKNQRTKGSDSSRGKPERYFPPGRPEGSDAGSAGSDNMAE